MWVITCPKCKHKAPMKDFDPSCADELTCPKCEFFFMIEFEDDEDDDDE